MLGALERVYNPRFLAILSLLQICYIFTTKETSRMKMFVSSLCKINIWILALRRLGIPPKSAGSVRIVLWLEHCVSKHSRHREMSAVRGN
jgi:hypothetical protein